MKIYIGEFEGNHWAVESEEGDDPSIYPYDDIIGVEAHQQAIKDYWEHLRSLPRILCSDSLVRGLKVGDVLPDCVEKTECTACKNSLVCQTNDICTWPDRIMLVPVTEQEKFIYLKTDRDGSHWGMTISDFFKQGINETQCRIQIFDETIIAGRNTGDTIKAKKEEQFWSGTYWVSTEHLVNRKVKPGTKTRTILVPVEAKQEQGERKLNYHKVLAETPPEVKKEVSDWMDEQDRIHSSLPVEFADWLGYHLYHYNRVERKWERHMTPPPNKYTTSEVFEIFIQLKMLEQDEDWLYQNWCSIWSLAYKLSKSDFLTKMKQDYFIQANKVK